MMTLSRVARMAAVLALTAGSIAVAVETADARAGRGGSSGSRGSQTHSAPPATSTAPGTAAPINRSMTQPGQPSTAAAAAARQPGAAAQTASRFGGMKGLLLGGLIGAGLATMFGAGALANVLGFVLQMLLIAGVVMLIVAFFRSRSTNRPALASAAAGGGATANPDQPAYRATASSLGGGAGVTLAQTDYEAFERLLSEVQTLYGQNDVDALGSRLTPEMLSYFAHELDENAKNGVINEISDVKLLQGDLSEAWREGTYEYATVAMRYTMIDATVEARTGRVVAGNKTQPQEITEIWTFSRPAHGRADQWELSAIQQTA
jgi:predicted lipid-binding transport protein (Tim44 family)